MCFLKLQHVELSWPPVDKGANMCLLAFFVGPQSSRGAEKNDDGVEDNVQCRFLMVH